MAVYFQEDELQSKDTYVGLQRGRSEGHAQPPAARSLPASTATERTQGRRADLHSCVSNRSSHHTRCSCAAVA